MEAGILQETDAREYVFTYGEDYHGEPVCLAMPVRKEAYHSIHLFPYFFNMLSVMLATAQHDTIGAVTVKPL